MQNKTTFVDYDESNDLFRVHFQENEEVASFAPYTYSGTCIAQASVDMGLQRPVHPSLIALVYILETDDFDPDGVSDNPQEKLGSCYVQD